MDDIRTCVTRLVNNQPGAHQAMADFCGVGTPAVLSWAEGKHFPKGEALVRVLVFVQATGCKSSEWAGMTALSRELAKLVAHNLITLEEVREGVGYESMNGVLSTILRGNAPITTRLYRIERLLEDYKSEIEAADGALRSKLAGFSSVTPFEESSSAVDDVQPASTSVVDTTSIPAPEEQVVLADASVMVRPTVLTIGALAALIDELDGGPDCDAHRKAVLLAAGPATIHKMANWFKRAEALL